MENGSSRYTAPNFISTDLRRLFPIAMPRASAPELIVDLRAHSHEFPLQEDDPHSDAQDFGVNCMGFASLVRSVRQIEALHLLSNGLAHDLNNLFQIATSSLSLIELRAKVGRDADIPALIEKAELALERAKEVVRRLILLPVQSTGDVDRVDVNSTIIGLHSMLSLLAGPRIDVTLALTPLRPVISCDVLDFENALLNLVTNARNAIANVGTITIDTSVEPRGPLDCGDNRHPSVVVRISDTGRGMTRDVVERAFDAFYSTRASSEGTGLGLAMVRRFLSDVGGFSQIGSTIESGTLVSLFIPIVKEITRDG